MRLSKPFVVVCLAASFGLAGAAQGPGFSKKQWQALYDKGTECLNRKVYDKIAAYFAPNWKHYTPAGKVDETGNDPARLENQFAGMKTILVHFDVLSSEKKGAAILVHTHFIFSLWTQPRHDHKSHHVLNVGLADDTWSKTNGRWLMSATRTLTEKPTMDGKPGSW
jgi:hypothetical protein